MSIVRTEPQRLISLALSILRRYFTDSLHSLTILHDLVAAEQGVAPAAATLLRDLSSFPAVAVLHYWRQSARLRGCKLLHCHLPGTPDPQHRRRHSTR